MSCKILHHRTSFPAITVLILVLLAFSVPHAEAFSSNQPSLLSSLRRKATHQEFVCTDDDDDDDDDDIPHTIDYSNGRSQSASAYDNENGFLDSERRRTLVAPLTFCITAASMTNTISSLPSNANAATPIIVPSTTSKQLIKAQTITIPLKSTGTSYLIYYRVDSTLFRAVLDTGSPFLMIPGSACSPNTRSKSGCYRNQGVPSGLKTTFEQFDGFQGEVMWRSAPFSFVNATGSMIVNRPMITFGVADDDIMSGPGGIFFGLIKYTEAWIRPSFLGQTNVTSFVIDLKDENTLNEREGGESTSTQMQMQSEIQSPSLTLSTTPLLTSGDYIPMTNDLQRKYGDPVQHYVAKAKSILINSTPLTPLDNKPIYIIFDTGVTGMVVSQELFNQRYTEARQNRDRNLWGGQVEIMFQTAQKNIKAMTATKPFTTPFDPKATWKGFRGHVIVVGLAFLDGKKMTVDIDDARLWVENE